nr:hypothetical protein [Tanacetum cinerariifolium]
MAFSSSGSSNSDTKNEAVIEEEIAFLKYDVNVRDNSITELKNQLKESLKEKDDLKLKLKKFETSSKNLTNLINSQISPKDKTGLSYDSQLNERDLNNKSDVFENASDSSVNESEEDNNQANDRYKADEGYHAVPPPYTGNFMPPRPDMSFAGLDDSIFKSTINETITSVHETKTSASKTSKECMEKSKSIRLSAPIIKDWKFDSDDDCEIRPSIDQNKMLKLILLNQMKVRPVWNNAQRVNHQNFSNNLTHPHPRRNFVPTAVITNSGKVPVNTAKQNSPRAAASTSTTRYVNNTATRPIVNGIKPQV